MKLLDWKINLSNSIDAISKWLGMDDLSYPTISMSGKDRVIILGPLTFVENDDNYSVSYLDIELTPIDSVKFEGSDECMYSLIDFGRLIDDYAFGLSLDNYLKLTSDSGLLNDYIWDKKLRKYLKRISYFNFRFTGSHWISYKLYDVVTEYDFSKVTELDPESFTLKRLCGEVPVIRELFSKKVLEALDELSRHVRIVGVRNDIRNQYGKRYSISVIVIAGGEYLHLDGLPEINKFIKKFE